MHVATTQTIIDPLNDAQRQAVMHLEGPLLMLAGPGSGKTRVITHRIAYLISQGVPSQSILSLTFTNKAADEMRNRLGKLVPGSHTWAGTFHRFCSRLLRQHAAMVGLSENFSIYDMADSKKVAKQAIENADVNSQHYSVDSLINQISTLKGSGLTPGDFTPRPGHPMDQIMNRVYPEYQAQLKLANAVDFDDLLLHTVDLLRHNPELRESLDQRYQYVMVDEYQDTNAAQYQLIRLLNHNVQNLGVTGDPDQSIYGWRGANLNNILEFERDYPQTVVVRLEQNYRSTKSILSIADQLIGNNLRRKQKNLVTENQQGSPVRLVTYPSPREESSDIADHIRLAIQKGEKKPRDYAIFYRANWLSRSFEHALRKEGIPYQIVNGHEFYQRREIKDVLAYLHLLNNPRDNVAFERIVNVPSRKIGKVTLGRIRNYARSENMCLLDAARQCGLISTISKAAATKVAKFVALFDELSVLATDDVESIIKMVVTETGYREWLVMDGSDEGHERAGNVDELIVAAQEFDMEHPEDGGLEAYLEQTALVSDTDAWESDANYVTLMTIHAAKGLEFPSVFIVGCEDGILPHERSQESDEEIEEERRLLFVGITRAQSELQLSRCISRFKRGAFWPAIASRFLLELPRSEMLIVEPATADILDYDEFENADDVPFEVDPWMQEAIQVDADDRDSRGQEEDESDHDLSPTPPEPVENKPTLSRLMTGAEFAEQAAAKTHPSRFETGMLVEHEEYGTGTITELSGSKMKRIASVDFTEQGMKRFRLAFCNLKIVGKRPDNV
ncbi:MAG: UvrD-helicase domain-containing protein [Mariniblastus sp.]|nr:UvrD-helicase domain-containing protein [Mariniblastus sp.]